MPGRLVKILCRWEADRTRQGAAPARLTVIDGAIRIIIGK
jgi:hypothetical protein